jgi:hypothetical protein
MYCIRVIFGWAVYKICYELVLMMEKIDIPVSVSFTFDSERRKVEPRALLWNGRLYSIKKIGFHHTFRKGRTLFHVFSVVSKTLFFRIVLNTDNLHWRLEEISDGLPN